MSLQSKFDVIVLYDGYCVLCNWFVRLVLRMDRRGVIGFAPLTSECARLAADSLPKGVDSVIVIDGDRTFVRSQAVFRVFERIGGLWKGMTILRVLPTALTDRVYDFIAVRRKKLFGRYEACPLPEERFRSRFLA